MISIDLDKPVARGRTADIYDWEDGWVLKLFHDWFNVENIQFEQMIARDLQAAGLPVPSVGEILKEHGRNGLLYERIVGQNMWELLEKCPWLVLKLAHQTAQLHAGMHANTLRPNLPHQHRRLENKLRDADSLPDFLRNRTLATLSLLPEGNSICHGDFHPGNILLSSDRAVVIDWIDASLGNPLADVARTSIIILGAAASPQIPNYSVKVLIRLFHLFYLRTYFKLRPGGLAEYRRWLPVVAAGRLSEKIPELERWLFKQAERVL
jgi:Ser/Thr protein kinase RdoA (MazF antagonist)